MGDLRLRTFDHPAAQGRKPETGDHSWHIKIRLDDGRDLWLEMGRFAHDALSAMLARESLEDAIAGAEEGLRAE